MEISAAFQQLRAREARAAKADKTLKLKDDELLAFTESCRDLYETGVPINEILRQLQHATPNKRFAMGLGLMVDDIENGKLFSEALARFPNVFGEDYQALIHAAELSGKWTRRWNKQGELREGILEMLIRYIKKRGATREKVKSGLMYPSIVVVAILAALTVFAFYVLPALRDFLTQVNPGSNEGFLTSAMFWVGDMVSAYWWAIPLVAAGSGFLLWYYVTSPQGQKLWMKYQLRTPILSPLYIRTNLAEIMWLMGTLFSAGLTPQEVMDITAQSTRNTEISNALKEARESLFQGVSFSETLKKSHTIFDGHPYMVLSTAQKSGRLGVALQNYAEQLFEQADRQIDRLVKLLEPTLLVGAGIIVGLMVIAFYGSLSAAIGRLAAGH